MQNLSLEARQKDLNARLRDARQAWNRARANGQPDNCDEAIQVDILSALLSEVSFYLGERDTRY